LDSQSKKRETTGVPIKDRQRNERRLARGLEDVSHLFLSPDKAEGTTGKSREQADQGVSVSTETPKLGIPFVLQASRPIPREMLVSLLNRNASALEAGMHVIDADLPCDSYGCLDLLAVDSFSNLVLIEVDVEQNDGALLRGIGHHDWFQRNQPIVQRMYWVRQINFSVYPRLFLVAPEFSPLLLGAVQRCSSLKVSCFRYRALEMYGGPGIFFELI
jgi:hypothetical protein